MIRSYPRVTLAIGAAIALISLVSVAQTATHYEIDTSLDYDHGTFHGQVTVEVRNESNSPASELFFRLFANDASTYGSAFIHVDEVSVQSASLPLSLYVNNTVLMVPLSEPLQPEESIAVTLTFDGQTSTWPEDSPGGSDETGYGLLTKSGSAMTLTAFYPILAMHTDGAWALNPGTGFGDLLSAEAADYDVRLTLKAGPIPVTTGALVSTLTEADAATYVYEAQRVRDFSAVLVDPAYIALEVQGADTTVHAWFTADHETAGFDADILGVDAANLYGQIVAPCPFMDVQFVEVPLRYAAGVEFSGLILVGAQYAARPDDPFFTIIICHEMAHQWFYAGVGNDASEHPWLDEGFATYLSYEFLDSHVGSAAAEAELGAWRASYETAQEAWPALSVDSPTYAFPDSSTYSAFVYSGGATLLSALRTALGDDAFYRAIRAYYGAFLHRIATPDDVFRAFEDACDCSLDDLLSTFGIAP